MADSDSEISFESADEGEMEKAAKDQGGDDTGAQGSSANASRSASSPRDANSARTGDRSGDGSGTGDVDGEGDGEVVSKDGAEVDARTSSDTVAAKEADKQKATSNESEPISTSEETNRGLAGMTNKPEGEKEEGEEEEEKRAEPVGEEIRDRGSTETEEGDARAGGAPQHAAPAGGESAGGSWGWGGWGSSLLTSAAATVTKVSDNVGKGLTSVLENVESSLGVPKPEELSEFEKQEAAKTGEEVEETRKQPAQPEDGDSSTKEADKSGETEGGEEREHAAASAAGIGGLFTFGASALTNVMEKTVTGGLDALEAIGRKTMDILQEGDPRLEKKRHFVNPRKEKTNLSEVLRQAKEEAEAEAARRQEEEELQKYNFGLLFDQFQGLAHLEALEMLSNQSETRVQSSVAVVTDEALEGVKTELVEVRDAFQMEDMDAVDEESTSDQDFVNVVTELLFSLSVAATPDKLQRAQKEAKDWLSGHGARKGGDSVEEESEELKVQDVHAKAMRTLAELTSRTIEQFHKVAELMLLEEERGQERTERPRSPMESATTLSKLASILSAEVSTISTRFCELLTTMADQSEEVNTIITNIYVEASNSTSYIQDAFQLLLPVVQDIAVRRKNMQASS